MSARHLGPYRLEGVIARSATSEVHRAVDTRRGRAVALKLLSPRSAEDPQARARFEHEARAMVRMRSPHLLPVRACGRVEGRPFIEMPLVVARDLRALLDERGPLAIPLAVSVVEQVAAALDTAHAAGIVHRDLKPENVLVTDSGRSYLIDFGLAHSSASAWSTDPRMVVGTMPYLAPERLTGRHDHRSDVHALAFLLFELLTGRPPYSGDGVAELARAHRSPPPRASHTRADVGVVLDEVLRRGLHPDPRSRFQRAGAFAAAVRRAAELPATARPPATAPVSRGRRTRSAGRVIGAHRAPSGRVAGFPGGGAALALVIALAVLLAVLALVLTSAPGSGRIGSGASGPPHTSSRSGAPVGGVPALHGPGGS